LRQPSRIPSSPPRSEDRRDRKMLQRPGRVKQAFVL
jgi:hypothetical protein